MTNKSPAITTEMLRNVAPIRVLMRRLLLQYDQENSEEVREKVYVSLRTSIAPRNQLESNALRCTDINEHLATLYMLTRELNLKSVLELGVRQGESTLTLLEAAKAIGGTVTSVDTEDCVIAKKRVTEAGLDRHWEFLRGDDMSIPWNEDIGHLFIDTSHTYEHTIAELRRFEPYVQSGGIVTLHDTASCSGVRQATSEFLRDRPDLTGYTFFNNNGLEVIFKK